jgi:hypothetical protein
MMIMVGDVLKKTSAVFGDGMWEVEDFARSMCGFDSSPISLHCESSTSLFKPGRICL